MVYNLQNGATIGDLDREISCLCSLIVEDLAMVYGMAIDQVLF
jgi:hypothetical protein